MSWGYGNDEPKTVENAIGIHGDEGTGESATMFSNDGMSSNNVAFKALIEKGYEMADVQNAVERVQRAIQLGKAPSEMPVGKIPYGEMIELYDETATQMGAPRSDEIEAQRAAQDSLVSTIYDNANKGGNMVGSAVGTAIGSTTGGYNSQLDKIAAESEIPGHTKGKVGEMASLSEGNLGHLTPLTTPGMGQSQSIGIA